MQAKAVRLLLTGAIRFEVLGATYARARVVGDSDDYLVSYSSGRYSCPCPHQGAECSHVIALNKVLRAVLPALDTKGADVHHGDEAGSGGDNPGTDFFGD